MPYDSTEDTKAHIRQVRDLLEIVVGKLAVRALFHDTSKLEEPEKSLYDQYKPKIAETEKRFGYGSPEYKAVLEQMGPALSHHYASNSHHPEHYPNGVEGMSLPDVLEMLADWKSSSLGSGQPLNLEANRLRFGISDQLFEILKNTIKELEW